MNKALPQYKSSFNSFVRLRTEKYRPGCTITLRVASSSWEKELPGLYEGDSWCFELPLNLCLEPIKASFLLDRGVAMSAAPFVLPTGSFDISFDDDIVSFPGLHGSIVIENGYVQRMLLSQTPDEDKLYDVIVVGSGIGGGVLAKSLAERGLGVLVLEAGSCLFPTHVGNLARPQNIGRLSKPWALMSSGFQAETVSNEAGSTYMGGQTFNLGGRSIFWGGVIPRMAAWEVRIHGVYRHHDGPRAPATVKSRGAGGSMWDCQRACVAAVAVQPLSAGWGNRLGGADLSIQAVTA